MKVLSQPTAENWGQRTLWLTGGTVAVWAIYDVWAMRRGGLHATISDNVKRAAVTWPAVPFLCGALMAHFYWYQEQEVIIQTQNAAGNVTSVQAVRRRDLIHVLTHPQL